MFISEYPNRIALELISIINNLKHILDMREAKVMQRIACFIAKAFVVLALKDVLLMLYKKMTMTR